MNNKVRVGVLAGLLLAPATLANANEQAPIIQQNEQLPFAVVANITDREVLLSQFKSLEERSTPLALETARAAFEGFTVEQRDVLENDLDLIEAKLEYLESHAESMQNLRNIKAEIDTLAVTLPTLIAKVPSVMDDYEAELEELARIQLAFRTKFDESASDQKIAIKGALQYADNNEPQNVTLAKQIVTNFKKLEDFEKDIVLPEAFIDNYIKNGQLQALVKDTYKAIIAAAKTDYGALNANQKKMLAAYIVEDELTAYQVYKNAEDVEKAVEKADQLYTTILSTNYTSVSSLKNQMKNFEDALDVIGEDYKDLLQGVPAIIEELQNVWSLVEAIDNLKVDDYRTVDDVTNLTILNKLDADYGEIDSNLKIRVFNYNKLFTAINDVAIADAVIGLIDLLTIGDPDTLQKATDAYNKLSATQKKLVPAETYNHLKNFQQDNRSAASVVKAIDALKPSLDSSFLSRLKAARGSYDKLSTESQQHVSNIVTLTELEKFKGMVETVVNLKLPSSTEETVAQYESAVANARAEYELVKNIDISSLALSNDLQTLLTSVVQAADTRLQIAEADIARAQEIVTAIRGLAGVSVDVLLEKLSDARKLYDEKAVPNETLGTSANAKKLVHNYNVLVTLEKQYTAVLKVTKDIETLPSYYDKTSLLGRIQSVQKNYSSLGTAMQAYVYNKEQLNKLAPVAQFMLDVNALKPKDANYGANVEQLKTDFEAIKTSFTAEINLLKMLNEKYVVKLTTASTNISGAAAVVTKIEQLKLLTNDTVGKEIADIKAAYKAVKQKNLVTNYKDFQAIEKNYKAASKVIKLIDTLPTATQADAKNYAKKVEAAKKAYDKLDSAQAVYVVNYNTLVTVIESAQVIGMIADLKTSSKDYLTKFEAAKAAYEKLSETDKARVVNADILTTGDGMKASVEQVEALIDVAVPTATDYIDKLIAARNAYDSLSKDEQRMVSNIKDLTAREKAVKPVLKLTEDIAALDPSNTTRFISQYKSAIKAHEKLSFADRALVANEQRLVTELAPIFKVMEQISLIKESSKTFVEDVTKARTAYNALSAGDKAQVSNYARLLEQELNVQGGARVDDMIRAIKGSNPREYVANVKAARAAYNSLSSANKRGVTLLNDLKTEENYIKPVETVIKLIEGLSNPRNDLAKQVTNIQKALAKLNNEQQAFVTNMSDYTDLSSIVHVYELIEKLKPSDKYYMGNLQAAQTAYGRLSAEEKMRVTNYYKLQEAITNVEGVENVIRTIAGLSSSSSTYLTDVEKALDLYKALPSALKKQVHNYDILKNAEKSIKNAQKVINTIDQIDPTVRSFESKVKSARRAYDKLAPEDKVLVTNYIFLTRYELELGL
ncbi:hypothetical protein P9B03_04595 [Metasolibacillus meyeri]|uniref:Cell wall-binding protein n=1 Tax=Metasolibacillus meyeri TaxID=1071052 RepID=A0AAW9NGM5_9BACL|nr:hypothetical protein [Metasolibacillus meyeri]MEC1177754.1 hypothetical protein [Metasolibacillus meyeri]